MVIQFDYHAKMGVLGTHYGLTCLPQKNCRDFKPDLIYAENLLQEYQYGHFLQV